MLNETYELREAIASIESQGVRVPEIALVLGSGLKDFAQKLTSAIEVPFSAVPRWPQPKVEGHGGSFVVGLLDGVRVGCLTGRVHLYEGWQPAEVVRAVRSLRLWGVETFLLTNAAGAIREGSSPGQLMILRDHLNLTGRSPLLGDHEETFGPRFPDMSKVYDEGLRERLHSCAKRLGQDITEGVYAGMLGPSYETPAEIQMLKALGADAVGMSTVLEAVALHAMGARVAGVSLLSNPAAGISDKPLSHEEVLAAGRAASTRLTELVRAFCLTR